MSRLFSASLLSIVLIAGCGTGNPIAVAFVERRQSAYLTQRTPVGPDRLAA